MKITVKDGSRELTIECEGAYELDYLTSAQIRHLFQALKSDDSHSKKPEAAKRSITKNEQRVQAVVDVLRSFPPTTAIKIAEVVKGNPLFDVPGGEPVHAIRRILKDDRFAKTGNGLFTLAERLELGRLSSNDAADLIGPLEFPLTMGDE